MRYVPLGTVSAQESQAVYHAVARLMEDGGRPTLITVSPDRPYVCVGYHQAASREIDREYCEAKGIPVGRRMVGGGAVYLDHDQIFWHLVLPGAARPVQNLYDEMLEAPVEAYRRMGIEARHRPVNDICVGPRKIGGTGAATIGGATVLVGSIMMDFDVATMARVLRVPSEKFRDKMVASLEDYITTVRRELGERAPGREAATQLLVQAFADVLGEPVEADALTVGEERETQRLAQALFDPAFVYQKEGWLEPGVKVREGVRLMEGVHKAPGGLIRVIYRERDGVFDDVLVSGDFFVDPPDGLERLAQALVGRPVGQDGIREALSAGISGLTLPGVSADDIGAAFHAAQAQK